MTDVILFPAQGQALSPPPPPASAADLLEQVLDRFRRGEKCYLEKLLEAGRLANHYVRAARAEGRSRPAAIKTLAGRLVEVSGMAVDPNRLLAASQVIDHLASDTDYSGMPYRTLRELVPLLQRDRVSEDWRIRPGLEQAGRDLFRRAVEQHLDAQAVAELVRLTINPDAQPRRKPGRKAESDTEASRMDPLAYLHAHDARDVASVLVRLLGRHPDPSGLGTALAEGLLVAGANKVANALLLRLRAAERNGAPG